MLRLGPPFPRPLRDSDGGLAERDVEVLALADGGEVSAEDDNDGELAGRDCWEGADVVGGGCCDDVSSGDDDLSDGDRGGDMEETRHGNILCPVRGSYLEKSCIRKELDI